MIGRLHHVGLSVSDLNRSIEFYRDVFGFRPLGPTEGFAGAAYDQLLALPSVRGRVAMIALGRVRLELFEFESPKPRAQDPFYAVSNHGITHFCIEVDRVRDLYDRLVEKNVRCHCPPTFFEGEGYATYIRDPDGNVIEIFEPTARSVHLQT